MQSLFCRRCESLNLPGSERCRICNSRLDGDSVSTQTSLGDIREDSKPREDTFDYEFEESPEIVDHVFAESVNPDAPYLPYVPRSGQLDIIRDIRACLDSSKHIVMESGTGTGKTIVALAGALEHSVPRQKKVVYLTRTISQSNQVMRELKAISTLKPVSGLPITGRGRSCPLFRSAPGEEQLPPSVLSSLCENRKRGKGGTCRYYQRTNDLVNQVWDYCRTEFPTSQQLDNYCEDKGLCPYEAKKVLMKSADVVVAPYVHILSDDIRDTFMGNMDVDSKSITVIVDEAHNIIDAAKEQESFRISVQMVDAAIDECSTFRGTSIGHGIRIDDFLKEIRLIIKNTANQKLSVISQEALIELDVLKHGLMRKFDIDGRSLNVAITNLVDTGSERSRLMTENNEQKVSDIDTIAVSLQNWLGATGDNYIKTIKASDKGEYLYAACIEPVDVSDFMRGLDGGVHMSGTLRPIDQYVKTIGLPSGTISKVYPSPFPKENRLVVYMNDVTTRYKDMQNDPSIFSRIQRRTAKLCNAVEKNTLVFFTSYRIMNQMRPFLERDVKLPMYWEESGQPRRTMEELEKFKKGSGGVFFSVMGGSVAEGIDFPGDELSMAIIIGIPYPPPSLEASALSEIYDTRFGRGSGWKYVSEAPATRKIKQAIGRLIRTETDRGMCVIFDKRAGRYATDLEARSTKDPIRDAVEFFGNE
ncbi:MAG TPA: ATP-dependent DNA helicase [Candidatus Methanomethylophilaceae archaeon]|nr:ATP-dependent DNA helicase [Candidatus Methanomethylophilaceae archaeon]